MLWNEVLELATDNLSETTSDNDYFQRSKMVFIGSLAQHTASKEIRCLEYNDDGYAIALVRGQVLYDLPEDCLGIEKVRYNTDSGWFLDYVEKRPEITPDYSDYPVQYWLHGLNKIGIYNPPSSTAAFTLTHTGTGTACTAANDGTTWTNTVTGVGAYTYTLATYSTVTLLVAAMNLDTGTSGITAVALSGDEDPADLEVVTAESIYEDTGTYYVNCTDSIYIWGKRACPTYAFRIQHDDTASPTSVTFTVDSTNFSIVTTGSQLATLAESNGDSTAATYQVTDTQLIVIITGGVKAGTYTLTLATYGTMALLAAAVTALAINVTLTVLHEATPGSLAVKAASDCHGKTVTLLQEATTTSLALGTYTTVGSLITAINAAGAHCTAARGETCPTGNLTADLEIISGYDILNTNRRVYFNPELPDDILEDVVVEAIMVKQKRKDKKYDDANIHRAEKVGGTATHKALQWQRKREHGNLAMGDAYSKFGLRDDNY